jgi:23S rRNA pseudouridine2605 synthase
MVLQGRPCGRVGHRRTHIEEWPPEDGWPFLVNGPLQHGRSTVEFDEDSTHERNIVSDSKDESDKRERPKRNERAGERSQGSGRGTSAGRSSGERSAKRPSGDRDTKRPYSGGAEKRPYSGGEKRPYSGDRDAKRPYSSGSRGGDDRRAGDRGRPDARGPKHDVPRDTYGAADLAVRPRHDDPEIPAGIEPRDLDKGARAELRTLSKENADQVAMHLVAASQLLDEDAELAHRHAMSAARRAGRVAVVRETLAITAYATGDFALALRELRTFRRISGSNDQLPLMVDSERGVGRPDRALEVGRAVDRAELPATVQVGLAIAMSGARLDLEQPELALAELEIPQLDPDRAFSYSPALFSAYAEVLDELGRGAEAAAWRARADRAEEALGEPAESELVEIYEVELEDSDEHDEGDHDQDPGAVLEDDVAAVLAEGASLDGNAEPDSADENHEDTPDGPVPSQD